MVLDIGKEALIDHGNNSFRDKGGLSEELSHVAETRVDQHFFMFEALRIIG